jgi:hypothetical protein
MEFDLLMMCDGLEFKEVFKFRYLCGWRGDGHGSGIYTSVSRPAFKTFAPASSSESESNGLLKSGVAPHPECRGMGLFIFGEFWKFAELN